MSKYLKLQKENNKLEKMISKENIDKHTNMIVYLRGAKINEYQQEIIRQDITNMIIEAQDRGESIDDIFGEDTKKFMDNVIESAPKISLKEKILSSIKFVLLIILIFLVMFLVRDLIFYFAKRDSTPIMINISIGDSLTALVVTLISLTIVQRIINTSFKKEISNKKSKRNYILGICGFITGLFSSRIESIINSKFGNITPKFPLHLYLILLFTLIIIYVLLGKYLDKKYNIEI